MPGRAAAHQRPKRPVPVRPGARMPDGAGETLRELPATEWGGRQGSDLDFAHDGARRRASRDLRR